MAYAIHCSIFKNKNSHCTIVLIVEIVVTTIMGELICAPTVITTVIETSMEQGIYYLKI